VVGDLREPEHAIGHRKHGIVAQLLVAIVAEQEGRGLPTREVQGQPLHEALDVQRALRPPGGQMPDVVEGIQHDEARAPLLHLPRDVRQHLVQLLGQDRVAQVDEVDARPYLGRVEVGHLLLIAQHLERRFTDDAEVEGAPLRGGQGEQDLMGQGGLPAARGAGDQVEGVFRQPTTQNLVETGYTRGQAHDGHARCLVLAHLCPSDSTGPWASSGQASRIKRIARSSPINVISSPMM